MFSGTIRVHQGSKEASSNICKVFDTNKAWRKIRPYFRFQILQSRQNWTRQPTSACTNAHRRPPRSESPLYLIIWHGPFLERPRLLINMYQLAPWRTAELRCGHSLPITHDSGMPKEVIEGIPGKPLKCTVLVCINLVSQNGHARRSFVCRGKIELGAPTFCSALTFSFSNLNVTLFNQLILLCVEGIYMLIWAWWLMSALHFS